MNSLLVFITAAHAQTADPAPTGQAAPGGTTQPTGADTPPPDTGGLLGSPLPVMLAIMLVFWFVLIRPQMKQQKQHRKMIADVKKGDEIVTAGGLHGKVTEIKDDKTLMLWVAPNVVVCMERSQIQNIKGYAPQGAK